MSTVHQFCNLVVCVIYLRVSGQCYQAIVTSIYNQVNLHQTGSENNNIGTQLWTRDLNT